MSARQWSCSNIFSRAFLVARSHLSAKVLVTLLVAFGFLPQNFGRWRGPTSCSFAPAVFLYICSLIFTGKLLAQFFVSNYKFIKCYFQKTCVPVYAHAIVYALCFKSDSTGKANCVQIFRNDAKSTGSFEEVIEIEKIITMINSFWFLFVQYCIDVLLSVKQYTQNWYET